ncbi:glucosaminidase domain-containing protein [Oceanobacter sp. 5_MG-2023]|uniref:glucosaminidase domain-containing protein n=1 Tax=Oceanobacter sp. 5_MG-2023 TaxID=3062645 RepID=UPI0026E39E10|nr:glucosaminidase domain-containing protein [Oceanobacter sp. 5_MG-2023]MDO6682501.1 glucosaminidase domain-containing protein [Oceanobacter sp. 5_MG-2023]
MSRPTTSRTSLPLLPLSVLATTVALVLTGCDQSAEPAAPEPVQPQEQAQEQTQPQEPAPTPEAQPESAASEAAPESEMPTVEVAPQTVKAVQSPAEPEHTGTVTLPDFASYTDVKQKKEAFFGYMLKLVKHANANVLKERDIIKQWDGNSAASPAISALVEKYRVDDTLSTSDQKASLLKRVQVIPPSLVLAQGANESAWGTSRFARQGNNFFGQWCFSKGCGIVPSQRNDGAGHEVAKFDDPLESVESYIRNLNSHPTYQKLRDLRNTEMATQGYPTGINLAGGLEGYSERGHEYIKEIRSMISFNKIDQLDPDVQTDLKANTQED